MTKTDLRKNCEVCSATKLQIIHSQYFIKAGINPHFSYDVAMCKKCGFIFAANIPTQQYFDFYYKKDNKYIYSSYQGEPSAIAKKAHKIEFNFLNNYLLRKFKKSVHLLSIVDIGCSTGHFLSLFKRNRYINLIGVDPAPNCKIYAKKRYGINIVTNTYSQFVRREKFDLIIFGSVLEHISSLNEVVVKMSNLLKQNGLFFIAVPDVEKFGNKIIEPFNEFSLEHINYFTINSLANLLGRYGFSLVDFQSKAVDIYGSYALNSLWVYNSKSRKIKKDTVGIKKITEYIKASENKLQLVRQKINKMVILNEEVIIWGVGSLTSRLLATTDLKKLRIKLFIDNNPSLQGKSIINIPIESPNVLKGEKLPILISSLFYKDDIKKILKSEFHYQGKIITF